MLFCMRIQTYCHQFTGAKSSGDRYFYDAGGSLKIVFRGLSLCVIIRVTNQNDGYIPTFTLANAATKSDKKYGSYR